MFIIVTHYSLSHHCLYIHFHSAILYGIYDEMMKVTIIHSHFAPPTKWNVPSICQYFFSLSVIPSLLCGMEVTMHAWMNNETTMNAKCENHGIRTRQDARRRFKQFKWRIKLSWTMVKENYHQFIHVYKSIIVYIINYIYMLYALYWIVTDGQTRSFMRMSMRMNESKAIRNWFEFWMIMMVMIMIYIIIMYIYIFRTKFVWRHLECKYFMTCSEFYVNMNDGIFQKWQQKKGENSNTANRRNRTSVSI